MQINSVGVIRPSHVENEGVPAEQGSSGDFRSHPGACKDTALNHQFRVLGHHDFSNGSAVCRDVGDHAMVQQQGGITGANGRASVGVPLARRPPSLVDKRVAIL